MHHSESIKELAAALAKAQGQMGNAVKDSTNPHFKSKYADLASIWEACRKPLADNGLSVVQIPVGGPDTVIIITKLMHLSGEWIEGRLEMKPQVLTPQGIGSCVTYCRRYALAAMVGVAPDEDDGQAASQPAPQPPKPQAVKPTTAANNQALVAANRILLLQRQHGLSNEDVLTYGQIASVRDLTEAGSVKELDEAYVKLQEYVQVKQREIAEAS
jgi:hypothetical protein